VLLEGYEIWVSHLYDSDSWWVIIKHLCEGIENHKLNQGSNNFVSYFWGLRNYGRQQMMSTILNNLNIQSMAIQGIKYFIHYQKGVKILSATSVAWSRESGQKLEEGSETVRHKKINESSVEIIGHIFLVSHFLGLRNTSD